MTISLTIAAIIGLAILWFLAKYEKENRLFYAVLAIVILGMWLGPHIRFGEREPPHPSAGAVNVPPELMKRPPGW